MGIRKLTAERLFDIFLREHILIELVTGVTNFEVLDKLLYEIMDGFTVEIRVGALIEYRLYSCATRGFATQPSESF